MQEKEPPTKLFIHMCTLLCHVFEASRACACTYTMMKEQNTKRLTNAHVCLWSGVSEQDHAASSLWRTEAEQREQMLH